MRVMDTYWWNNIFAMDDFNFYRFIAYLIGFAIAALLLLKLYLMYTFRKLEKAERQQREEQPK